MWYGKRNYAPLDSQLILISPYRSSNPHSLSLTLTGKVPLFPCSILSTLLLSIASITTGPNLTLATPENSSSRLYIILTPYRHSGLHHPPNIIRLTQIRIAFTMSNWRRLVMLHPRPGVFTWDGGLLVGDVAGDG